MATIRYTTFDTPTGELWLAYDGNTNDKGGACALAYARQGVEPEDYLRYSGRLPANALFVRDDKGLAVIIAEIQAFLEGQLLALTFSISTHGTPFQESVWKALRAIPYGETRSYKDIAISVGKPAAMRAVGTACGANPLLIITPCHRVLAHDGSLGGFASGLDNKRWLLALEKRGWDERRKAA